MDLIHKLVLLMKMIFPSISLSAVSLGQMAPFFPQLRVFLAVVEEYEVDQGVEL
jgi:hypothetical protein